MVMLAARRAVCRRCVDGQMAVPRGILRIDGMCDIPLFYVQAGSIMAPPVLVGLMRWIAVLRGFSLVALVELAFEA